MQLKLEHIKYLLPMQFCLGFFFCFKYLDFNNIEFILINILLIIISILFIKKTLLIDINNIAVWFFICLFSYLYFIRFFWLIVDPTPIFPMLHIFTYIIITSNEGALYDAYILSSIVFIIFCLLTIAFSYLFKNKVISYKKLYINNFNFNNINILGIILLITNILLIFQFSYLTQKYNIGIMGVNNINPLPYKLTGIIFYFKIITIPLMMLMGISLANMVNNLLLTRLSIFVFLLNSCCDMLLRNSRGSLLFSLLILLILIIVIPIKLKKIDFIFVSLLLIFSLTIVPITIEYRKIRTNFDLSMYESLIIIFKVNYIDVIYQYFDGLLFVLFRYPGIESLWSLLSLTQYPIIQGRVWNIIFESGGISAYLTKFIHFIPGNTYAAPGFIGWFYIIGGIVSAIISAIIFSFISVYVWSTILNNKLIVFKDTSKVFYLWIFFLALTDGNIDGLLLSLIVGILTIIIQNFLFIKLVNSSTKCNFD